MFSYFVKFKQYSCLEMWWLIAGNVVDWWLIASAPDFCVIGPGFESGIYHNDPDALQDHIE